MDRAKKREWERDTSVMIELQQNQPKGSVHSHMRSVTQDMCYRQSLLEYAQKNGVSRASRKYNKSRSYIYFWKAWCDVYS